MASLHIFFNDLRLSSNQALKDCCSSADDIICLYVYDNKIAANLGSSQRWWLSESLSHLGDALQLKNICFVYKTGDTLSEVKKIHKDYPLSSIHYNISSDPTARSIQDDIFKHFEDLDTDVCVSYFDRLVNYDSVKPASGPYMKVFTPFYRKAYKNMIYAEPFSAPRKRKSPALKIKSSCIKISSSMSKKLENFNWHPGEKGSLNALKKFINENLESYADARDIPSIASTSCLSAHLHFGEISPWQVICEVKSASASGVAKEMFIRQLFWREFASYLLWYFPSLPSKNFRSKFDKFKWSKNKSRLDKWKKGQTGFPIVDAGMRQLLNTGFMHNRVRMIVASFLIKDLQIDWREGEKWFSEMLVDADVANNALGWQWVAGSGPDSAPYFRIFNPTLQSQKFDKGGEYIREWVPELASVPSKYIHNPESYPEEVLREAGIVLGENYPEPIVDHAQARKESLEKYRRL